MFEIFKSSFRCLNIKAIWPEFAVILLSLFVTCCDAPWPGALCRDGRGFKWIPVTISNPGVITILFIISAHYVIVTRVLTWRRITSDCHRQEILFVTFIVHPPSEIKNWVSLKDEILPRIESMLEIGVRCWVKWIYRGTVTESIPRISTNTKLTANNIQQKKVLESLLLIEFPPGFSVFVVINLIIIINPRVKLSFMRKGNMSWSF